MGLRSRSSWCVSCPVGPGARRGRPGSMPVASRAAVDLPLVSPVPRRCLRRRCFVARAGGATTAPTIPSPMLALPGASRCFSMPRAALARRSRPVSSSRLTPHGVFAPSVAYKCARACKLRIASRQLARSGAFAQSAPNTLLQRHVSHASRLGECFGRLWEKLPVIATDVHSFGKLSQRPSGLRPSNAVRSGGRTEPP